MSIYSARKKKLDTSWKVASDRTRMMLQVLLFLQVFGKTPMDCAPKLETRLVRGVSMEPTFHDGDDIEIDWNYFHCREPKRHDVVVIKMEGRDVELMKEIRVVPGDRFSVKAHQGQKQLWVNEQLLRGPSKKPMELDDRAAAMLKLYEESFHGVMPAEAYFVFGVEFSGSFDSRKFGPVEKKQIVGKVLHIKK